MVQNCFGSRGGASGMSCQTISAGDPIPPAQNLACVAAGHLLHRADPMAWSHWPGLSDTRGSSPAEGSVFEVQPFSVFEYIDMSMTLVATYTHTTSAY